MERLSVALLCSAIACVVVLPASGARAFCWPWEHDFTGRSGYTRTHHPIVLAHGALGFDSMSVIGIDLIDYWYDIDSALADCGGASVHIAHVSPSNSTEYRGEQLLAQIQRVLAQTGASKVNLIGHSMGGLDARYVMAVRPDLVASLTTIGSPHKGGDVFDALAAGVAPEMSPLNWMADGVSAAVRLVWGLLGAPAGDVDTTQTLHALRRSTAARWNERYTAGLPASACGEGEPVWNGIPLFSWTGNNASPWTTSLNPLLSMDVMMNGLLAAVDALSREPTDGMVGVCSAHFGDVLRDDYNWNHVDEVNLLWGLTADFEVDPRTEFRKHANRLKQLGL